MIFLEPTDFDAALKTASERKILPTDLGSRDIVRWEQEVKRRSVFTSRGTNADFLQAIKDAVDDIGSGKINQATGRDRLKASLDLLEYSAEHGFPGDIEAGVPPAEEGSLQDLAGEDRLDLILDTQVRQVANFAFWSQGQTPFSLHAFPCWELIRISWRRVPRGERTVKGQVVPDPANAWPARWEKAGGALHSGRMVARKDDSIWDVLGSSELFSDGLGQPYPPFAFNSGMGFREVSREEAIALGVIAASDKVGSQTRGLNEGAVMSVKDLDADFLKALRADLDVEVKAGEARLRDEMSAAKRAYLAANEEVAMAMLDLLIDAANAWEEAKHPRGSDGRFIAKGAMDLGKNVARARKMLEQDLTDCGLDTVPPADVAAKLLQKLKVKKPVPVSDKLTGITGANAQESAAIHDQAQEIFDMLPPRVVNGHGAYGGLPAFRVCVVNNPAKGPAWYDGNVPKTIFLNRAGNGVTRENVFHEMGHYLQDEGPQSYRDAVHLHFARRTDGEAVQNTRGFNFKRDSWFSDYEGKIYRGEGGGIGSEIPSTRIEHMASERSAFYARSSTTNSDAYKETQAVAFSIFYYGRGK